MKTLKIILVLVVVAVIAFFAWPPPPPPLPPPPPPPENPFIERIEQKVDSLSKLPDSRFCKDLYKEIAYLINDGYANMCFAETPLVNDQWKENFTKNLYSAYTEKFIKQAFYVFRGSEWKTEDLRFIRSEYQILQRSKLLEHGSPVYNNFVEIEAIFSKYDEIINFVNICNGFSYSYSSLADRFPISDVKSKISQAKAYQNNNLENVYVNNCTRLHERLKNIPQSLFRAHVRYLDRKINEWSNMYPYYTSHSDYVSNLYNRLKSEIDALDNRVYNVTIFSSEYNKLIGKWRADNNKASNHNY